MSAGDYPDEELMAFADGALDAARTGQIADAAAGDPALAARIETFRAARRTARGALLDAPGGDALTARIAAMAGAARREADAAASPAVRVVARPARDRPSWRRPSWRRPSWRDLPLAASIALAFALGGAVGYVLSPGDGPSDGVGATARIAVAAPLEGALADAVARIPSGARARLPGGRTLHAVASFRDGRRTLCRELEIAGEDARTAVLAVACGESEGWVVRFSIAVPAAGDGYAPASALEALDAYLAGIEASDPLEADDERAALAARAGG